MAFNVGDQVKIHDATIGCKAGKTGLITKVNTEGWAVWVLLDEPMPDDYSTCEDVRIYYKTSTPAMDLEIIPKTPTPKPILEEEPHCIYHGQEDEVWVHDHEEPVPSEPDPVPSGVATPPTDILVQSISLVTEHGTLSVQSPDEGITVYRILKEHWPDLHGQIVITL